MRDHHPGSMKDHHPGSMKDHHPGYVRQEIHHPGYVRQEIHHPGSMRGYTTRVACGDTPPRVCTGLYTTQGMYRSIHHPGIYQAIHPWVHTLIPWLAHRTGQWCTGQRCPVMRAWAQERGNPWVRASLSAKSVKSVTVGRRFCAELRMSPGEKQ